MFQNKCASIYFQPIYFWAFFFLYVLFVFSYSWNTFWKIFQYVIWMFYMKIDMKYVFHYEIYFYIHFEFIGIFVHRMGSPMHNLPMNQSIKNLLLFIYLGEQSCINCKFYSGKCRVELEQRLKFFLVIKMSIFGPSRPLHISEQSSCWEERLKMVWRSYRLWWEFSGVSGNI